MRTRTLLAALIMPLLAFLPLLAPRWRRQRLPR
jgi:hypothetical protein